MHIFLDLAVILLLVIAIINGTRKGLIKTAFKLCIIIVSIIIATKFSPALCEYVKTTSQYTAITESVKQSVTDSIIKSIEEKQSELQQDNSSQDQKRLFDEVLSKIGFDTNALYEQYNNKVSQGVQDTARIANDLIITPAAEFICRSLCFIVLFIVSILVLNILMLLLDLIFKLPILKSLNRLFGGLLGIAFGVVKIFVFCTIVMILLMYIEVPKIGFVRGIQDSTKLFKLFLDINPLSFLYR